MIKCVAMLADSFCASRSYIIYNVEQNIIIVIRCAWRCWWTTLCASRSWRRSARRPRRSRRPRASRRSGTSVCECVCVCARARVCVRARVREPFLRLEAVTTPCPASSGSRTRACVHAWLCVHPCIRNPLEPLLIKLIKGYVDDADLSRRLKILYEVAHV